MAGTVTIKYSYGQVLENVEASEVTINLLHGVQGPQGLQGDEGPTGPQGDPGADAVLPDNLAFEDVNNNFSTPQTVNGDILALIGFLISQNTGAGANLIANVTDGATASLKAGISQQQFKFDENFLFAIAKDTKANILAGIGAGNNLFTIDPITGNIGIGIVDEATERLEVIGHVLATGFKSSENTPEKFFTSDGEVTVLTTNITSSVTFVKLNTWVNTQQSPITGAITYSLTNAVNGAVSCVYYKAATLVITDPDKRIVILNDNNFVANELCLIFFMYDKGSGAIHVNVLSGDTFNRPFAEGSIPAAATNLILTQSTI